MQQREPKLIKSSHTLFLEKPPCCLEFFPGSADGCFVVGTYNLISAETAEAGNDEDYGGNEQEVADEKKTQERDGSLIVCIVVGDIIKVIEELPVPFGVLDIRFSPRVPSLVAAATSTGSLAFYLLINNDDIPATFHLKHLHTLRLFDASVIVTSLAWKPNCEEMEEICVTLTTGEVTIVRIPLLVVESHPIKTETKQEVLHTHGLEAWTTVYTGSDWLPQGIFSGGDDATIAFVSLSKIASDAKNGDETVVQASTNRRVHSAGVTAILPLPFPIFPQGVFLTGSYDDHLRIFSLPSLSSPQFRPQVLHEVNLGGGVWRIKLLSTEQFQEDRVNAEILVSCMYAGAFVVKIVLDMGEWSTEVLAKFGEHESMCYACDVLPAVLPTREDDREAEDIGRVNVGVDDNAKQTQKNEPRATTLQKTIISSSFYDKRLCLWKW